VEGPRRPPPPAVRKLCVAPSRRARGAREVVQLLGGAPDPSTEIPGFPLPREGPSRGWSLEGERGREESPFVCAGKVPPRTPQALGAGPGLGAGGPGGNICSALMRGAVRLGVEDTVVGRRASKGSQAAPAAREGGVPGPLPLPPQ
jgi:hypothetical protein